MDVSGEQNDQLWKPQRASDGCALSFYDTISVTNKMSPNVYKSCPKMISLEKLMILTLIIGRVPKKLPIVYKSCPKMISL